MFKCDNDSQYANMFDMSWTCEVSKLDKSKLIIWESKNIPAIFVTLLVSKFFKFKLFNDEVVLNIFAILVKSDVEKLEISKYCNPLQ